MRPRFLFEASKRKPPRPVERKDAERLPTPCVSGAFMLRGPGIETTHVIGLSVHAPVAIPPQRRFLAAWFFKNWDEKRIVFLLFPLPLLFPTGVESKGGGPQSPSFVPFQGGVGGNRNPPTFLVGFGEVSFRKRHLPKILINFTKILRLFLRKFFLHFA